MHRSVGKNSDCSMRGPGSIASVRWGLKRLDTNLLHPLETETFNLYSSFLIAPILLGGLKDHTYSSIRVGLITIWSCSLSLDERGPIYIKLQYCSLKSFKVPAIQPLIAIGIKFDQWSHDIISGYLQIL